jgi:uncharacterized protein with NAD-binding domain and iron-sulfur cluster
MKIRIVVIGGGIGGLTVAHELGERGFEVHVYETRRALGGKARTEPVAGTGVGGRLDLPGEHGFRFYPRFYRHVIDTMARTPIGAGSKEHVASRLRPCTEAGVALIDGDTWTRFHRRGVMRPMELVDGAEVLFQQFGLDPADAALFGLKVLQFLTSCENRRLGEIEGMSWWTFLGGDGFSQRCQARANAIPRMMVAMDARRGSDRTIGNASMQLLLDFSASGADNDRTMGGPTSQMWIEPWVDYLEQLGVRFHLGDTCTGIDVADGRVVGARFGDGTVARGDHFVLAVPIDAVPGLMSDELAVLDPQCERLRGANIDELVSWMVGIQFFLRDDVPLARGHMIFPDSPWALTAISQPQFWQETVGPFRDRFGDGTLGGLISVDISQWDTVGPFVRKTARECTPEEVKMEVWSQLKAALNGRTPDQRVLTDSMLHSWHIDEDVEFSEGGARLNRSRLLVHPPGSWAVRPDAASAVTNLCFASDYVRTHTDIASMEAACEAGRRAANVILDREQAAGSRAGIWPLAEPLEFEPWKQLDAELHERSQPHLFETLGIRHAFEAANLLRCVAGYTGLSRVDDLFREIKLTSVVGGWFDRLGLPR